MNRLKGQVVLMASQLGSWRSTLEPGPGVHWNSQELTHSPDPARQQRARLALLAIAVLPFLVFLRGYLASRALWYDEAMLADAVLADPRTLAALPYNQVAPVGFLLAIKTLVHTVGWRSEYALRLLPLITTSLVPVLVFLSARRIGLGTNAFFAALLAATAPSLFYYSGEFKPYGIDAFIAALLLFLAAGENPWGPAHFLTVTIVAAIVPWFSFPAVLMLSGVWLSYLWRGGSRGRVLAVGAAACISLVSWGAAYLLAKRLVTYAALENYWTTGFLPFPPRSVNDAMVWLQRFLALFSESFSRPNERWSVGHADGLLMAAMWAIGLVALWRTSRRPAVALLAAPVVALLAAAALSRYPAADRLILFLVPSIAISAAAGVEYIGGFAGTPGRLTIMALLLFFPALALAQELKSPTPREEFRTVLKLIAPRVAPGDVVYLYSGAVPEYEYYARDPRFALPQGALIVKGSLWRSHPLGYVAEICGLPKDRRTWVLFSHPWGADQDFVQQTFGRSSLKSEADAPSADAYLLDRTTPQVDAACVLAMAAR